MLHVICYDISDDRRRRKLEKAIKGFGPRVQESVFEADLDEKRLIALREKIERRIDPALDSVRIYRQCAACRACVEVLGRGPLPVEPVKVMVV